ncbi:MAG: c-type cytochrome [Alphaproteobacteria bacterium]
MVNPLPLDRIARAGLVTGTALTAFAGVAAAQDDDRVERGEYLATAANCASCHTAEDGEAFAGGLPVETPFGVLHSPNITPDEATGIGDYSEADFVAAMRQGLNGDGEPMYPAHPYTFFSQMPDEDIAAIWAYMQSLEPVENEVQVNRLSFPYNIRAGLTAWQAVFHDPDARFEPDPDKSEEWNRGAYLVEAVTHCGACHTPRNVAFARDEDRTLEGAEIRGWYAPNITAGDTSLIEDWSVDELTSYLQSGETSDNETSFGPMDEVVHESLAKLRTEDVRAMAVYLKDLRPTDESDLPGSISRDYSELADAEQLYITNCVGCHRRDGEGVPGAAPALAGNSAVTAAEPNNVIMAMLRGLPPEDEWGGMPSYIDQLSNVEIAEITRYVRTAWGNDASERTTARLVGQLRLEATDVMGDDPWQAMCANLPRSQVDGDLVTYIGELSEQGFTDEEITEAVEYYAREFPDVDAGTALLGLSTAYCRHLAQSEPNREEALGMIGRFNNRISAEIGGEMPEVADAESE